MIAFNTESHCVVMLQLLLLLLLYECSAQERSDMVRCNSEPGSCDQVTKTCEQEYTSIGRLDTCFPPRQDDRSVVGSSAGCRYQSCDQEGTSGVAPYVLQGNSLMVTFSPTNPDRYDATVSWRASYSSHHTGYKIALLYKYPYEQQYVPSTCTCLYTTSVQNYTFNNLQYSSGSMKFEVTSLPYNGYQNEFMISTELSSPANCQSFDTYDRRSCSPPAYGRVTHPQAVTELFLSPDGLRMSLFLSWQPPDTNVTRYPLPSSYYLVLVDLDSTYSRTTCGENPRCYLVLVDLDSTYSRTTCGENPRCFKTSGTLNATISPLDPSRRYRVIINAYVKCSGLEVEDTTGCSAKRTVIIPRPRPLPSSTLPPSLLPSSTLPPPFLPSSILPSPPHTFTPSQATVTMTQSIELQAPAVVNGSIIAGAVVAVILTVVVMFTLLLIYMAVKKYKWKGNKPKLQDVEKFRQKPLDRRERKKDPLVLVIYSPNSSEEDKHLVLQYLVEDLCKYCRVECHDCIVVQQSAPAWLDKKVREASVVLCVCNAQFQQEWDQEVTSLYPLVFSLEQLVHGILNKSNPLSGKFATVLLRESEHECIPGYLRSTRKFLVDEVKAIARFVQGFPEYESSGQC